MEQPCSILKMTTSYIYTRVVDRRNDPMNIAFKELNQDGELILNDKYGDDVEITESGTVDC